MIFSNYLIRKIGSLFYDKKYLEYLEINQILHALFFQKILRINSEIPWPCQYRVSIHHWENIKFYPEDIGNFQVPGNHFCAIASIKIGKGVKIGPFGSIVTSNDDEIGEECASPVIIGDYSVIFIRSIVLPGVELGPYTIVGAGSVVTRSFPEGYVVLGGNPANIIKFRDREKIK